ncbi:MAG: acyl-CoA desaturase [Actinomycetota bacterium]|nr:acyl-CoA desaturase [Actinomycetota bacterium]
MPTTHPELTEAQIEALGNELDELRNRVRADLGERDAEYIRRMIAAQRGLEVTGRALLFAGFLPPAWLGGVTALSLSKILDNMEIGHNVMHGQYDWMKDPALDSKRFEWDTACPGDQWRHSHNYMHHTHTNVLGKDRDIGYGILRMSEDQEWRPRDLGNPVYATLLALLFQWGVAVHDLEVERIEAGEISLGDKKDILQAIWQKGRRQVLKDYVAFPLLAGPVAPFVFTGNLTSNLVRNVWSYMIIFCGHFPEGTHEFSEEEVENETRGGWYVRQMLGSANLTGSRLFHILSGNLSHQIEHHVFPDIPAHRYGEIAVEVREICGRYGIPYNTGPLHKQFGSVVKKIVRLALPGSGSGDSARAPEAAVVPAGETTVGTKPSRRPARAPEVAVTV